MDLGVHFYGHQSTEMDCCYSFTVRKEVVINFIMFNDGVFDFVAAQFRSVANHIGATTAMHLPQPPNHTSAASTR